MTDALSFGASPAADQVEVSVLGPGKGEAIAVHLGGGDWITVDSCRNQRTRNHPVLEYFENIGVDASEAVRLVVATHAHDDHVAGIAKLYSVCAKASLVTSHAITSQEFFANIERDQDLEGLLGRRVLAEYDSLFAEVERRDAVGGISHLKRATEQYLLWHREESELLPAATVRSLSPSHKAVTRALKFLAQSVAGVGDRPRWNEADPNEFAIALWITVGDVDILLGADLTVGPDGCGWKAVVLTHAPASKASLYKVPHHGSPNANFEPVWTGLLEADVVSLVTPFRGSSNPRPSEADVAEIVSRSGRAYAAARNAPPAASALVRKTKQALGGLAENIREGDGLPGHIQARKIIGNDSPWVVEVKAPAYQLP